MFSPELTLFSKFFIQSRKNNTKRLFDWVQFRAFRCHRVRPGRFARQIHSPCPASGIKAHKERRASLVRLFETLDVVVKYDYTEDVRPARMTLKTRPVSWIRAARKEFEKFPPEAQLICLTALTVAAEGEKADIAKPLHGFGTGVFEIALPFRGDAFRVVYAVQIGADIWVIHAFQKKSTQGIKTPKHEIDLIRERLRKLKEVLQ
jgi:phage-related protein